MITGFLKLLAGVWSWIGRILAGLGAWLRKPHDWWRIGFFTSGAAFMVASFVAWEARREIVIVIEQCKVQMNTVEAAAKQATDTADANVLAAKECKTRLAAEVGRGQEIARLATQALLISGRTEDKAQADLAAWQKTYQQRPATCDAALKQMEAACASSASDY